ncbi:MAG: hypothetical protein VB031_09150 [Eubacteriaceae bacterium]|nr:hypothetical protein [Eubacteriaceae bacterium]
MSFRLSAESQIVGELIKTSIENSSGLGKRSIDEFQEEFRRLELPENKEEMNDNSLN